MANIISASIPAGQSLSGPIGLSVPTGPVCIMLPKAWQNPVLMTFQISADGGATWYDVYRADGTEYTLVVNPGTLVIFSEYLDWAAMVRIRSGSGKAPVPQPQVCNFQMILN